MRKIETALAAAIIITLAGCAKMGQPDGGWYDETPPRVVGTFPTDKSTGVSTKNITILFDEFIKLENPSEKVVISPPQMEAAEIKGAGRRITVQLFDTLKANTTYTVDFSDAISDNNEGNPMGNYTYSFSTGSTIDTMEVAGRVVEAEDLEPLKGILVGLYSNLSDTAFTTSPMIRVARTDSRGKFIIKGVAPGQYRIYALQDVDANYQFSQKSEKLAFSHDVIVPSSKPDVRQDTLWRDSLHIDNIIQTGYTHFLPDDIVLRAFTETLTERHLLKTERKEPEYFTMFFTYGDRMLPKIDGLNFDSTDAFMIESTEHRDTITYWLRDTTLVNQDTLLVKRTYMATDTAGVLTQTTDTVEILSKISYAKRLKDKQKEYEKWEKAQEKAKKRGEDYLTEMPAKPLEMKTAIQSDMMPDGYVTFESPTPLLAPNISKIHLRTKIDTVAVDKPFTLTPIGLDTTLTNGVCRKYILRPDSTDNLWTPGTQYTVEADSAAFNDIYGNSSSPIKKGMTVRKESDFTTITFHVAATEQAPYVGQLLDSGQKVVKQTSSPTGDLTFQFVKPGDYYLRVWVDSNGNGLWNTGCYADDLQAETVYYYPEKFECKAHWPFERNWNPATTAKQSLKPDAITKQKGDKQKKIKNQNAERARKMGIIYIPQNH